MKQENDSLEFKKSVNSDFSDKDNIRYSEQQRKIIKSHSNDTYNFSQEDIEKIISFLEKKENNQNLKNSKTNVNENRNSKDINLNSYKNDSGDLIQKKSLDTSIQQSKVENSENLKNKNVYLNPNEKHEDFSQKYRNQINFQEENQQDSIQEKQEIENQNSVLMDEIIVDRQIENEQTNSTNWNKNVDDIVADIIPDYNQHISIEVNNVDLTFEVSNEKVDTIKEYFIRTLKRNKSKKIEIHALKDVSFKIYKGEKVGIIGYNGAGKSTLLSVITGIYPPDNGFVKTSGNISPLLSLGAGFDYNYSGRKNIFLNGAVLGYEKSFLESKVDEIIEFSELGDFIDIPIKNYSSGMLAKLGFSIATAVNPDILIIDEILGVGDVNFHKKSTDKIRSLMDGGTTVLFVSHSIPQVRELCDKAIWIDEGKIREIGEVNKVCDYYIKDSEKASNEQLANIQLR